MIKKVAILMSGGFDSIAVAERVKDVEAAYVFFKYGQLYEGKEYKAAAMYTARQSHKLKTYRLSQGTTDMPGRNFLFLLRLKQEGYTHVYMGTRNPTYIGDKYGDSNYIALKLFAWLLGIKVKFPVMWWTKRRIFRYLFKEDLQFYGYNCYNNKDNYLTCDCVNCKERRQIHGIHSS
jgi:7-cyano-7-deazaguanine synthase in queuosine biosynthesis